MAEPDVIPSEQMYADALARARAAEGRVEAAERGMTEVSTTNIVLTEQRNMAQAEARGYAEDLARAQIALRFIAAHPNGVADHHPSFVARAALACPPQQPPAWPGAGPDERDYSPETP